MIAYLALVWDACDQVQTVEALKLRSAVRRCRKTWPVLVDENGLFVTLRPVSRNEIDEAYLLKDGRGVVLGKLFPREFAESDAAASLPPVRTLFDESASKKIVSDRGDTLRDCYWGRYVAFLRSFEEAKTWVLRDPTGQVPCQHFRERGVGIYFVRLEDLDAICTVSSQLNRHYLTGLILLNSFVTNETGYQSISTVLPGERVEHHSHSTKRDFYWSGVEFARQHASISTRDACRETRRTVTSCVHAWASCFKSLALQLSGGVDSSILAACLASSPTRPEVTAVNWYSTRETTDERRFARAVAQRAGFALLERYDRESSISLAPSPVRTVIPAVLGWESPGWVELSREFVQKGIFANFRGDGGDELFYKEGPLPDAVDFAFNRGVQLELWRVAMNDALIDRKSIWSVLRQAMKYGLLGRRYNWSRFLASPFAPIFNEDALQHAVEDSTYCHPLLRTELPCSPAKAAQVQSLLRYTMVVYEAAREEDAPLDCIRPFISQPHMEFSLRTPLHILRSGGRDRAMIRAAFADEVPSEILYRRYKGVATIPAERWVGESIAEARELLMEGYLTRERILNRRALESMLARQGATGYAFASAIKACLEVEVWARDAIQATRCPETVAVNEA